MPTPGRPTFAPTLKPTQPTGQPTAHPSRQPTGQPSAQPSAQPRSRPTSQPTTQPSGRPSAQPVSAPTSQPTNPTGQPTRQPTSRPSARPTTYARTAISFNITMQLSGINYTSFSTSVMAQLAVKQAIISLLPKLTASSIRIVPRIVSAGRRLFARLLSSGSYVVFDVVVATTAEELGFTGANQAKVADNAYASVTNAVAAAVGDGSFVSAVIQQASALGTPVLSAVTAGTVSATSAVKTTAARTGFPTGQPSAQPTAQPSRQPTRQPSGQPSSRPSGQPTTAPSNPPTVAFILIDIDFLLQSALPKGSKFNVFIPQVAASSLSFPCTIVQRYAAMPINRWYPYWFGVNQTLQLTALVSFSPGPQSFTVGSPDLVLKDTAIYQDDPSLTYSLVDKASGLVTAGGVFDHVVARGLASSSLSYEPPRGGKVVSMRLGFVGERPLLPNDRVFVFLPGFSGVADNTKMLLPGAGNSSFTAKWNSRINAITFTITRSVTTINVTVPRSLGLTLNANGSNNYTGYPTIALRTHNWGSVVSRGYQYFAPTRFLHFSPVAFLLHSILSFTSPAVAGQAVGLLVDIGYSLGIRRGDVFNVSLPKFWSSSSAGLAVSSRSGGSFTAVWVPCDETLMLQASNVVYNYSSIYLTVTGLRLPWGGVSVDLSKHFNITSSAASGSLQATTIHASQRVGVFGYSALSFSPGTVNANQDSLNLTVQLSAALHAGEYITLNLPGVTLNTATPGLAEFNPFSAVGRVSTFTVSAPTASSLRFTAIAYIAPATGATFVVTPATMVLPSVGFPTSVTSVATIATGASEGPVVAEALKTPPFVGISASVYYDLLRDASQPIGLRFRCLLSGAIAPDDQIVFFAPYVTSTTSNLALMGDWGEESFVTSFTGVQSAGTFTFTATNSVAAGRDFSIHVGVSNKIYLTSSFPSASLHTVSATVVSVGGAIAAQTITYSPATLASLRVTQAGVNVSSCAHGVSCALQFDIEVKTALGPGEHLAFSHPSLTRNVDVNEITTVQTNLTTNGNATSYFLASWRPADNTNALSFSGASISLESAGRLLTATDNEMHPVNATLPSALVGTSPVVIATSLPRIVTFFAQGSLSALVCGDSIVVQVRFSEPVDVLGSGPSMLLSTRESALYLSGNGTSTLLLVYNVRAPLLDVADLRAVGPGAMEYFGPAMVTRSGWPAVRANVTLPPPYNRLLRDGGVFKALSVTCAATATVVSVSHYVYTPKNMYRTGDVLDIRVVFSRPVRAMGSPVLLLQASTGGPVYPAVFVNVSYSMWLDVQQDSGQAGQFVLFHEGQETPCMGWNDTQALVSQLSALPSLQHSLPLKIRTYALASGLRYRLTFANVAPAVLAVPRLRCDIEASASVFLDPASANYSSVVFRYVVQANASAAGLSYPNTSALLQTASDFLYVAGLPSSKRVDAALPRPSAAGGLANNSAFDNRLVISTTAPTVLSVYGSLNRSGVVAPAASSGMAVSGDTISIFVNFSAPVVVTGGLPLLLLRFSKFVEGATPNQTLFTRYSAMAPLSGASTTLTFVYAVRTGDNATGSFVANNNFLNYYSSDSLVLNGSSIRLASLVPSTPASVKLPDPSDHVRSLYASQLRVLATQVPVLRAVYTDHPPGVYGVGEDIVVYLDFSSPVFVHFNAAARPTVALAIPLGAHMTYLGGSSTTTLAFTYTVSPGDSAFLSWSHPSSPSWNLTLAGGNFIDVVSNRWSAITTMPSNLSQLLLVEIDTHAPKVLLVNSSSADGIYYPGQAVDLSVVFNKKVIVTGGGLPSVIVDIPHFEGLSHQALLYAGNGTTTLQFRLVVPAVPDNLRPSVTTRLALDYAGTASLLLNGSTILDFTTHPTTAASYYLPSRSVSYLAYHRQIFVQLTVPEVREVYALPRLADVPVVPRTVTAGDTLLLAVRFTQSVMVLHPPTLRLATGATQRDGRYLSGNGSSTLIFAYVVQPGDTAPTLDYADTRLPPYNLRSRPFSLALNTDIHLPGSTGRSVVVDPSLPRFDDIIFVASAYGGVFQASGSDGALVPARTHLPLPGAAGSLSLSRVTVDTSPPSVIKVLTGIANGVYSAGVSIPVILRWNAAVFVSGCPVVLFRVLGADRPATYASGSGTAELVFSFNVSATDVGTELDYVDRHSLQLRPCSDQQAEQGAVFIRRLSAAPTVDANLTLPWVKYVESIVAPTSLVGSGHMLALAGPFAAPRAVWSDQAGGRSYSVGDVININVGFSRPVGLVNSSLLLVTSAGVSAPPRAVYYDHNANATTATFALTVQADEAFSGLTYTGPDALRTARLCDISDLSDTSIACAAQNLPLPGSALSLSLDALTSAGLVITSLPRLQVASAEMVFTSVSLGEDSSAGSVLGTPIARAGAALSNRSALCDAAGHSFLYRELLDAPSNRRVIFTTGCPNHAAVCQKASCTGSSGSDALVRSLRWEVPLVPVFALRPSNVTCSATEVAVALNGVSIYSQADESGTCGDGVQSSLSELDSCGGRSGSDQVYAYRVPPSCLLRQLGPPGAFDASATLHSPQVGWALDGFPVYGPRSLGGLAIAPCSAYVPTRNATGQLIYPAYCLDECGGLAGSFPGLDAFTYRYYLAGPQASGQCDGKSCAREDSPCCLPPSAQPAQSFRPYTIGCLKGCLLSDYGCRQTALKAPTTTAGLKPSSPRIPTIVYDGSPASVQATFDASTSDPGLYLPSAVWDVATATPSSQLPQQGRVVRAGDVLSVAVTMSEAVLVEGRPTLSLFFNATGGAVKEAAARFAYLSSPRVLVFQLPILPSDPAGTLLCSLASTVSPSGGRVMKAANFLPLLAAELSLGSTCCLGATCLPTVVATVSPSVPRVLLATWLAAEHQYQGTTYSSSEEITLLVSFSRPVTVVGQLVLLLDLPGTPSASYVRKFNSTCLLFVYIVRDVDASSALEYASLDALRVVSAGKFDGVWAQGAYSLVRADLTLPVPGSAASLSRQAALALDNDRPKIVSISAQPAQATSGDDVFITLLYSTAMVARLDGVDVLSAQAVADGGNSTALQLSLVIAPPPEPGQSAPIPCSAVLVGVSGATVTFKLRVLPSDPSGALLFAAASPFVQLPGATLASAKNGALGPTSLTAALLSQTLSQVDNLPPFVVNVFSPNRTIAFPWGSGDSIDIYLNFSQRVVVMAQPALVLVLGLDAGPATAVFVPTPGAAYEQLLHFRYLVRSGDSSLPLEYVGVDALQGDVRRYSRSALLQADLTLPAAFSFGSLGYCCNVRVDTSRPFVQALWPVKRAGVYGHGETVLVVARFNKPVVVTGFPTLRLWVGTTASANGSSSPRVGVANFTKTFAIPELQVDILATDVFFLYTVQAADNIASLSHVDAHALVTGDGATIRHLTSTPVVDADTLLRDPADTTLSAGQLLRQWKFNYASKVELLLRNLYHTEASALSVSLQHVDRTASVFSACCRGTSIGRSYPGTRLGNNATWLGVETGIGETLLFSDSPLPNVAPLGSVEQSSTLSDARRAIDGNTDPLSGDLSVSETLVEDAAWWYLQLPAGSVVQTVNVWPRNTQSWVYPQLALTMRSFEGYAQGTFRLQIADYSAAAGAPLLTAPMPFNVSAAAMKLAIEASGPVGTVGVDLTVMQQCTAGGAGCGVGVQRGYGFIFTLTFRDLLVEAPALAVVQATFLGGPVTNAGREKKNVLGFSMSNSVDILRRGHYIPAPAAASSTAPGSNDYLTPFTVMFFDHRPPADLAQSRKQALLSFDVASITVVHSLVLQVPLACAYIKIQRQGHGALSLAEVEVFAERTNTLSAYALGSPLVPSTLTAPYQPQESFAHAFGSIAYDGMWVVQISQGAQGTDIKTPGGWSGAVGSLSEAVLVVTDLIGTVHAYYQDLSAVVTSLPKHGSLSVTSSSSSSGPASGYGDWREAFDVTAGGELAVRPGGYEKRGYCFGREASEQRDTTWGSGYSPGAAYYWCAQSFGQGPLLEALRVEGPTPLQVFLRRERVVTYTPRVGFLGSDYFSYQVYDGLNLQQYSTAAPGGAGAAAVVTAPSNEVTMHVRNCRVVAAYKASQRASPVHPLCTCASTARLAVGNATACAAARASTCLAPASRAYFPSLCLACSLGGRATYALLPASPAECAAHTLRAVAFLSSRGQCSPLPPMDCSAETITAQGGDAVSFLSVGPAFSDRDFSALGASVGGLGAYDSAPQA